MLIQQWEYDICAKQEQLIKTYDTRENLCKRLSSLVNLKSQGEQNGQFTDLMSIQEKQIWLTSEPICHQNSLFLRLVSGVCFHISPNQTKSRWRTRANYSERA